MNFTHLTFISICLASDAFAVSLAKGFIIEKLKFTEVFKISFIFAMSQTMMSFLGFKLGKLFIDQISGFSHIIIFLILIFTGSKMIFDAWREHQNRDAARFKLNSNLFILSLATGIDSLIIGTSFSSILSSNITFFIFFTAVITSIASLAGIFLGYKSSSFMSHYTNFIGGSVLILIGFKSLF